MRATAVRAVKAASCGRVLLAGILLAASVSGMAAPVCPTQPPVVEPGDPAQPPGAAPRITADSIELLDQGVSTLKGDVRLEHNGRVLEADSLFYDRQRNDIDVSGPVRVQDGDLGMVARTGQVDLDSGEGEFGDAEFSLTDGRGRGGARRLRNPRNGVMELEGVSYTTCNPGDDDWLLSADRLRINQNTGIGTARNTVIRFKGVPIFYSPYFSFPTGNERKSGFLVPSIGSSEETGLDIAAPYYFNLAPNVDATLTPRLMTRRGLQMIGDFRYLTRGSEGELAAEYLPSDDEEGGDTRHYTLWRHRALLSRNWALHVDYANVSDEEYFEDLDNTIGSSARNYLNRNARLHYQTAGGWLTFRGLMQDFQSLDRTLFSGNEPHALQPQLQLDLRSPETWPVQPGISTEFVRFVHSVGEEGSRIDVRPSLALSLDYLAWYLKSEAAYRYTRYDLDNRLPGLDESLTRSVPSLTLDTGLRFERYTRRGQIQTLEPRLFYVRVPFRDQTDFPDFDTGEPDFEFGQLFVENRYSGIDRIADADQATLALTSQLIDPASGRVGVKAGIGQIYRFDETDVLVPGTVPTDLDRSDVVAATEIAWARDLSTTLSLQYDPDDSRFDRGSLRMQYRPDRGTVLNAGYRFRRDLLEQTDLSFLWPLSPRWRALGRWNYSLRDDQEVETLAGLEYQSCCWALRMAYRRYISDTAGNYNDGIYLQLELTGLARLGDNFQSLLERDVRGYVAD
ncbi:MAG TPA: LPS-assembly protein LptD [Nevskiales bacterium]|nr:LPS-assembly protein LptD [Nevskiales bacterium]